MSQPINREQRRMLKKQGQSVNENGQVVEERSTKSSGSGAGSGGRVTEKGGVKEDPKSKRKEPVAVAERTGPVQFGKEVKTELSKVSWPSRTEVINYSIVVLVTVVVLTLFIGAIDWVFSTFVLELFEPRI